VTQERAEVADLGRRDPGLGEQVGAKQVREGPRIHLVVLQPCGGDRLAPEGVGQVGLHAEVLAQLREPPPPVRRLEDRGRPRPERTEDRGQLGGVVRHVAVHQLCAVLAEDRHLRPLAMHVHSDVDHERASFPELDYSGGA
jgi:hypothetical protein